MKILTPDEIRKPTALAEITSGYTEADWGSNQELLGGKTERVVLCPNRQWAGYITELELQRNNLFDSFTCVAQTSWNCIQCLAKKVFNIVLNKSKRFTAVLGGTTPGVGADVNSIMECIRKIGGVEESLWPTMTPEMTQDEFFKPIPQEIIDQESFLKAGWSIKHEWVQKSSVWSKSPTTDELWKMLQYSPICVAIDGSYVFQNGELKFQNPVYNHFVLIVGGELNDYWLVLDSENPEGLMKVEWNYQFAYCKNIFLSKPISYEDWLNQAEDRGIKELNSPKVYYISIGQKKYIPDEALMEMLGVRPDNIIIDSYNYLAQVPESSEVDMSFIPEERLKDIKFLISQMKDLQQLQKYKKYFPERF